MTKAKGQSVTGFYSAAEAIELVGVNQNIFRWIVSTEPIPAVFRIGKRPLYTAESVEAVRAFIRAKDPAGRFFCKPERRNGPRRKRRAAAAGD